MRPDEQERLLRGILADENIDRVREASLQSGLAALRSRRRRRSLLVGATLSTTVVAMLAVLLTAHRHRPATPESSSGRSTSSSIQVIDDRQLLALFSERSVALVGTPGRQKLIFLDSAPPAESPLAQH